MNKEFIYNNLPISLQNILCSVYGYNLKRIRYGKDFYKNLSLYKETSTWSENQIIEYKEEKIYNIIEYSFNNCPYYKRKYSEVGLSPRDFKSIDDLIKFPKLSKEDVRNNWKGMVSNEYSMKDLIKYHTSGSTGKALDFYWTLFSQQSYWAVVWRGRSRFGINLEDSHINFTGKMVVPINQSKPPFWRYNKPLNQIIVPMQQITKNKIPYIVDFINNSEFKYFIGYPSIINSLVVLAEECGLKFNKQPQFIFTGAEKLYDYQRDSITNSFNNVKIFEHYGFSENASSASKCNYDVYHEDFEIGHMELDNVINVNNGKFGEIIATGLVNMGMPFIRYQVGDSATFNNNKCSCGMNSQVIRNIEGRNEDYIITPEGAKIMRFDYIFKNSNTIKECQIVQKELGSIIIRIVKRETYSLKTENSLREEIKNKISPSILINFEYVNEISRTKSGKFKAVISEINK